MRKETTFNTVDPLLLKTLDFLPTEENEKQIFSLDSLIAPKHIAFASDYSTVTMDESSVESVFSLQISSDLQERLNQKEGYVLALAPLNDQGEIQIAQSILGETDGDKVVFSMETINHPGTFINDVNFKYQLIMREEVAEGMLPVYESLPVEVRITNIQSMDFAIIDTQSDSFIDGNDTDRPEVSIAVFEPTAFGVVVTVDGSLINSELSIFYANESYRLEYITKDGEYLNIIPIGANYEEYQTEDLLICMDQIDSKYYLGKIDITD